MQSAQHSTNDDGARAVAPGRWWLLGFVLLVYVLSIPFWFVGSVADFQLLPGLPAVDALIVFCPLFAACILSRGQVKELLKRVFDCRRIRHKIWYVPIVLLMPAVSCLAYALMRETQGPLPTPHIPVLTAPLLFLGFFAGAIGEEVGWTGYATERMRRTRPAWGVGLFLGVVWAAWHLPQLLQVQRSTAWIAWWCVGTIAARVLFVWVYENAGKSVFAIIVLHAMQNLSWQLFPGGASSWDPRLNALPRALRCCRDRRRALDATCTIVQRTRPEASGATTKVGWRWQRRVFSL